MRLATARAPVIPLEYARNYKALGRELMVDPTTGFQYLMSADRSRIINLSQAIKDQIDLVQSGIIHIEIEGEDRLLNEVIQEIRDTIDISIRATDPGNKSFYSGESVLDGTSLEVSEGKIQLKGFSEAPNGTFPYKDNGIIKYLNLQEVLETAIAGESDGSLGGTGGSDPEYENDGLFMGVYYVEPVNERAYLKATKRQVTLNLTMNVMVIVPTIIDQFCEIYWGFRTYEFQPSMSYTSNVSFKVGDTMQPTENAWHLLKLTTWDRGQHWLGDLQIFGPAINPEPEGMVTKQYLEENYYNMSYISSYYNTKIQNREVFYTKEETYNQFLSRDEYVPGSGGSGDPIDGLTLYEVKQIIEACLVWTDGTVDPFDGVDIDADYGTAVTEARVKQLIMRYLEWGSDTQGV
jgi:hypothetical protein